MQSKLAENSPRLFLPFRLQSSSRSIFLSRRSCTTAALPSSYASNPSTQVDKTQAKTDVPTVVPRPSYSQPLPLHLQPHHDLPSFVTHAARNSLSLTSTVYTGTYYEYLCLSVLRRLSFTLARVGGPSDLGIDLLGHWHLPSLPSPLQVLVQCKALKSSARPESIRELQGAIVGAPAAWQTEHGKEGAVVGVLCAKTKATMGVRRAVRRCGMPIVWVMIEDLGEGRGRVRQVLWNKKVDELGGEGLGVGVRYLGIGVEKEMVLMWRGELWEPDLLSEEGPIG